MENSDLQVTPDELYAQIGAQTIENKKLYQHIASLEEKIKSFTDAIEKSAKPEPVEAEIVEPSQNGTMPKKKKLIKS